MKLTEFCTKPFEEIEVHSTGEVYVCSPNWNNKYSLGNIFENSVDEVWNSTKAINLRKEILDKNYSNCDCTRCTYLQQKLFESEFDTICTPTMEQYPQIIRFVYDIECNINCKICRDKIIQLSDEELNTLNEKIDTFFLPLLKSAKVLVINSFGDSFGSRHSRLLIKKAVQMYPNLKFAFHTNGILCDKENLEELGITPDKIDSISISINAATKNTYAKNIPNGKKYFPKVINNINHLNKLKGRNYNFPIYIHFVVTSENYKEIPKFIEFSMKTKTSPRFWEFRRENACYEVKENLNICDPEHSKHKDLIKVLRHILVRQNPEFFSPILFDLIEE